MVNIQTCLVILTSRSQSITVTSQWAPWRLKSSAPRLLAPFVQAPSKKTSKLRVTGLCEGKPPVTGGFPSQRARNAENVSIWWRHHECTPGCFPLRTHWEHGIREPSCSLFCMVCTLYAYISSNDSITYNAAVVRGRRTFLQSNVCRYVIFKNRTILRIAVGLVDHICYRDSTTIVGVIRSNCVRWPQGDYPARTAPHAHTNSCLTAWYIYIYIYMDA